MRKKYNPNKIKSHRSYAVAEVAEVLKVHERTVRSWIKKGLPVVDESRPLLIHGKDLRNFIQDKNRKSKQRCKPCELFCVKCQSPQKPILDTVRFLQDVELIGRIIAGCSQCQSQINKFFAWKALEQTAVDLGMILPIPEKHISYRVGSLSNTTLEGASDDDEKG